MNTFPPMRNFLFLFLLLGFGTVSCRFVSDLDEIDLPDYAPEFAFPLVNSTFTIGELLEDFNSLSGAITVDSAGVLHFTYRGDLLTRTSTEIFGTISNALPPLIPVLSENFALPLILPSGVLLDRVDLKAGLFTFYAENPHPDPVQVRLTLPELQRQGSPFQIEFSIPGYSGSGPRPSSTNALTPAGLAGYAFLPDNDTVRIQYQAISSNGQRRQLSPFVVQFRDLAFSYAEGFLGRLLYEGERDSVRIDFFDTRYIQGNIRFSEPRVTFFFENSLGVPTQAIVNTFDVLTVRGERLKVESPFVDTGIEFPYPALNEVGQIKRRAFDFTRANSNVHVLLSAGPVAVVYDVDALTHPSGNTAERGFVTDNGYYRIQAEVDLPLIGEASGFEADRLFNIDFSDLKDAKKITIKMVADNGIPLDLDVQGYFLDSAGNQVDSLFNNPRRLVKAAPVGANGLPGSVQTTITEIPFEGARLQQILQSRQLKIQAAFSSNSNPGKDVKILSGQQFNLRLGAKTGL